MSHASVSREFSLSLKCPALVLVGSLSKSLTCPMLVLVVSLLVLHVPHCF